MIRVHVDTEKKLITFEGCDSCEVKRPEGYGVQFLDNELEQAASQLVQAGFDLAGNKILGIKFIRALFPECSLLTAKLAAERVIETYPQQWMVFYNDHHYGPFLTEELAERAIKKLRQEHPTSMPGFVRVLNRF